MIRIEHPLRFGAFVLATLAIIVVLALSTARLIFGPATIIKSGELTVTEGAAARAVWQAAVASELTASTWWWRYHASRQDAAGRLKVGTYEVKAGEKVSDIVARLVTGGTNSHELTITYPEGFTLEQMAARTEALDIGTADEFMQAASPANFSGELTFLAEIPPGRDLEGYLFPDTYRVFADDTPADVIRRLVTTFNERFSAELFQEARAQNRTLDQVVTMASIIEREVQNDEDMALVSGILWNRFDDGVGLAADATVRYALDKWDGPLTVQDLAVDSAYNTRRYRGLPPGPISNPGLRALVAAVRPAESEYYYYLSAPDGETIFSRTLDEHNANKAKHVR